MITLINIDLALVGIAVAGAAILGITVFVANTRSVTAKALLAYSLVTIFWSVANYASYRLSDPDQILVAIRLVLFFATWHAFTFFVLAFQFPLVEQRLKTWVMATLAAWTACVAVLTLTPLVYRAVTSIDPTITTETGPGIALFGVTVLSFIVSGFISLTFKTIRQGNSGREPYLVFVTGVTITFVFLVLFNFLLPAVANIPDLIPYGGLFQLPLIGFTAYAILRHKLFNVKVAATALLVFALAAMSVADIILADDISLIIFRVVVFSFVLFAGALLIRSVYKEVEQRETIERQEKELEEANAKQVSLLHFITHEIKGYLTKSQGAFAAIAEGDYGEVSPQVKELSTTALADVRRGVGTVTDILEASNLKKGTVTFESQEFDMAAAVEDAVCTLRTTAEEKGLLFEYAAPEGTLPFVGDREKLSRHVFRNLIDNAIRYTPHGSVRVALERASGAIRFSVQDSGVGITEEDRKRLFTEGGRGKDSTKVNVNSTGYGLFVAKQVVDAHKGKIWAESDGQGRGSRFIVEFPLT